MKSRRKYVHAVEVRVPCHAFAAFLANQRGDHPLAEDLPLPGLSGKLRAGLGLAERRDREHA
eukprot:3400783-Lingulodinium_polyedra.AAC.1